VIDAMSGAMETAYANVHRGLVGGAGVQELARRLARALETVRRRVRHEVQAAMHVEIILSIMEHHSNIVPWHFLRERRGAVLKFAPVDDGGELQHGAAALAQEVPGHDVGMVLHDRQDDLVTPWHFLRERRGAVLKFAPVDDEGNFLVEEYEKLFT
jgi:cysteine desulfurase/selenocysteine lyase